jgi:hypothetical protein
MSFHQESLPLTCKASPFTPERHLIKLSKNLPEFDRRCRSAQLLRRLTSLTITIEHVPLKPTWMKDMPLLVSSSPLEHLQLHAIAVLMDTRADDLVAALISTHGPRLKRLSLHRMTISLGVLDEACTGFTNLEQLFVFVRQEDLVSDYPEISSAAG